MIKPSTNSKSYMPIISKAKGKYVWDNKGNKYLDFTGSNLTVVLGYVPVKSVVPNLPGISKYELELKKNLTNYTNTSIFKFYKNGSDAISNVIRLSRYILNNNDAKIAFIGYAGSNNEYTYTFNSNGIPVQNTTQKIDYNIEYDILVFESRHEKIASQIKSKIKICDHLKSGILGLYENIDADFHCYGKSISNGSPLAVLTGKDNLMNQLDNVYYSTTYGCNQDAIIQCIYTITEFEKVKNKYLKMLDYAKSVLPVWKSLDLTDIIKLKENYNILYNGYWNLMTCHTKKDIDYLKLSLDKYNYV